MASNYEKYCAIIFMDIHTSTYIHLCIFNVCSDEKRKKILNKAHFFAEFLGSVILLLTIHIYTINK